MADSLVNSFDKTDLDLENSLPNGGPKKYPLPAYVSPNATGTPNKSSNPGPFKGFTQPYTPQNPYLSNISNRIIGTSMLSDNKDDPSVLSITNLDNTKPGVDGGIPYKQDKDPTSYPKYVSGTPTTTSNPGPVEKFDQPYNPKNVYVDEVNKNNSILSGTLANTNLDIENPLPNGGVPYKQDKDPTSYPKYVSGTPTTTSNPGPVEKFDQPYNPKNVYVDEVNKNNSILSGTLANTNLDIENPLPNGGVPYKQDKDPTSYPSTVRGTPTTTKNPGPAEKFDQPYNPQNTYVDGINNKIINIKTSMLSDNEDNPSVLSITGLDNSQPGVNGGIPYKTVNDPTNYPPTTNASSPIRGYFSKTGDPAPAQKYGSNTQVYSSTNTYTEFIKSYI